MMRYCFFYISFFFIWLISLLPFRIIYVIADIGYFLSYYLVRYRRKIVRQNIQNSFPQKNLEEIEKIEKGFYHYFCDVFLEAFKMYNMSDKSMRKHFKMENSELLNKLASDGKNVFLLLGHYGNWEWVSSLGLYIDHKYGRAQIYHPLKNPYWDKFFLRLRSRYHVTSVPMKKTFQHLLHYQRDKKPLVIGFIADQSPKPIALDCHFQFLNQETPFLTGAERLAQRTNSSIVYLDVYRLKRGYYKGVVKLMYENTEHLEKYEITKLYGKLMEETIVRDPSYWLWTHKRWKHKEKLV